MSSILKPLGVCFTGTSLTTGRLSADWVPTLEREVRTYPECIGPIRVWNRGHGGWTSADILASVPGIIALQPKYVLMESGSINDCFDGGSGPAISLVDHDANLTSTITQLQAGIPGVDITVQTMNPVATIIASGRPQLATYYAHDLSVSAGLSVRTIDNYAGWPNPLPQDLTYFTPGNQFVGPRPTGFFSWDPQSTWNPSDKSTDITLTNSNKTAKKTSAAFSYSGARGQTGLSSGKLYFECTAFKTSQVAAGLATTDWDLNSVPLTGTMTYWMDGSIRLANITVATAQTYNTGNVIQFAVDFSAGMFWARVSGGTWNGNALADPVTNVGGIALPVGTLYPMVVGNGIGDGMTENFGPDGDGLHPIWLGADDTYLFPDVKAWMRARMTEFWST